MTAMPQMKQRVEESEEDFSHKMSMRGKHLICGETYRVFGNERVAYKTIYNRVIHTESIKREDRPSDTYRYHMFFGFPEDNPETEDTLLAEKNLDVIIVKEGTFEIKHPYQVDVKGGVIALPARLYLNVRKEFIETVKARYSDTESELKETIQARRAVIQ